MHGENYQDGYSTRVRHVPIQIESRGPSTRGHHQRQSEEQVNDQTSRFINDPSNRQMRGNPQNVHQNERSYSPQNTSSINIDYEPPAPQRRPNTNYQAEGNLSSNYNHESSPNLSNQRDEEIHPHGRQYNTTPHAASKDRKRQPSKNPSPQQSDKLVGSPEPIPLPPPPADQQQNQHLNENNQKRQNKQKQQQESSGVHLPSDNKKENSSFTERDGSRGPQQNVDQQGQKGPQGSDRDTSVLGKINSVKEDVTKLLQQITEFSGISAKSKEYRFLDEMLTRCVLKLDNVECGDAAELRHQRKAAIKMVDKATDILQRKLQINSDIHDLSESMTVPS